MIALNVRRAHRVFPKAVLALRESKASNREKVFALRESTVQIL